MGVLAVVDGVTGVAGVTGLGTGVGTTGPMVDGGSSPWGSTLFQLLVTGHTSTHSPSSRICSPSR